MPIVIVDPTQRLPGEGSLNDEIRRMFEDAEHWMDHPHPMLGGRTPQKCVEAGEEQFVWDLLRSIKYVGQT